MVIQQYQDPRVGKYLKYGYWYHDHRDKLLLLARNFLIVAIGVIWAIFAYFAYNFILSQGQYNQVLEDLTLQRVNVAELQQTRAPSAPQINAVTVLPGEGETRADFIAGAANINPNWYLELDYNFVWADGQTTAETTLILPQSKTVLTSRGATVNGLPVEARLQILATRWHRLRERAAKDRVTAAQAGIIIDSPLATRDNGVTSATYIVKNQSIYNWLTPRFIVVLAQGGVPAAIGVNEIPELLSGGEQTVEYRWRQFLPSGLTAEVYSLLNPFDPSSYRLPPGGDYAL